jgi:hypothetical protein
MTTPSTTKTATKKAPAKAAPAKVETTDVKKTYTYRAAGRAGVTNTRTFPTEMVCAADVKDESHTSPRWKAGVITRFFASRESAERYAERQRETGCDVQLVDIELVEEA